MNLDLEFIKAQLEGSKLKPSSSKSDDRFWKPQEGKQVIRFLPYRDTGSPFWYYLFYYNFPNKGNHFLSPLTFGDEDPVNDLGQEIYQSAWADGIEKGSAKNKALLKKSNYCRPKEQYCVPIILRSDEGDELRFWRMTKALGDEIIKEWVLNEDYGVEVFDLEKGRDFTVTYTPGDKTDTGFAQTSVTPKPTVTVYTDDANLVEQIQNMPKMEDLFGTAPSYDTLVGYVEKWQKSTSTAATSQKVDIAQSNTGTSASDLDKELEDFFND